MKDNSMIARFTFRPVFCVLAFLLAAAPVFLRAQVEGPMQPPASERFPTPPRPSKPEPPALPPEEIIRRFAAKEDEMVRAITGYRFQKSVRVEEMGPGNKPTGQLEIVTQLWFGRDGKLYEKPLHREPSTLHVLDLERGDSALLAPVPLFPLTTAQLPKYDITYGGKQPLDQLTAYYFSVKPRALDRAHAYFSGEVWVDVQDLVIVKTIGKWVTELGAVTSSVLPFTVFETYRQQVGMNFWFPAYSRSDEIIDSGDTHVPIRVIVKWTNFTPLENSSQGETPPVETPPVAK
jgi:hypothetical protein